MSTDRFQDNVVESVRSLRPTAEGIHIWDSVQDRLIASLPSGTVPDEDSDPAFPVISTNGDRVAIAIGNIVHIYALPDGQLLRTITHPGMVNAIAFANVGRDIISGSADGALLLTNDDADSLPLPRLSGGVDAVALTPDGRLVMTGPGGKLRVLDLGRKVVLAELDCPIRVRSLRLSSDGTRLIAVPTAGPLAVPMLWNLEQYRLIAPLRVNGQVFSARFVRGDSEILTVSNDGCHDVCSSQ